MQVQQNRVNERGERDLKRRNRELFGVFLWAVPLLVVINYLGFLGLKSRGESGAVFYFAVLFPMQLIIIAVGSYGAFLGAKRMNNTVRTILAEGDIIEIETFPILRKKSKIIDLKYRDITRLSQRAFPWYGKEKLEGITIRTKAGEEYYLIKNYFDDYEGILRKLNSSKP